jgi:deoxyribose-phosphate aldolase
MTSAYAYRDIAKMIDHSMLAPTITVPELEAGIRLALEYDVASVCLVPSYVRRCADLLSGSSVIPSTVIGFPHGTQATKTKVDEAERALEDGALELDMVTNVGRVLGGDYA